MRQLLAQYFQRKQYCLRHKRYKLMLRWAHKATKSRDLDRLAQQATSKCNKLQLELDMANQRYQRLSVDDCYQEALIPSLRPSSKSSKSGGTLYVENKDLPP